MRSTSKELKFCFSQETTEEPLLDLYDTGSELVCEVDLPGIDPNDILIKIFDQLLVVEGVKREEGQKIKSQRYLCMERRPESFRRMIKLPARVNAHEGSASYEDGVVRIVLPKMTERVIKIKIQKKRAI